MVSVISSLNRIVLNKNSNHNRIQSNKKQASSSKSKGKYSQHSHPEKPAETTSNKPLLGNDCRQKDDGNNKALGGGNENDRMTGKDRFGFRNVRDGEFVSKSE
jgi:hypothetical protein